MESFKLCVTCSKKKKRLHNLAKMCHIQKVKNSFIKIESKNCWESFVLEKGLWPGLFF